MDYLGYLGGFFATVRYIPQITKIIKTKSSNDLSWGMLVMSLLAQGLTLIYSIDKVLLPIVIPLIIAIILTMILCVLKIIYDKTETEYYVPILD